MAAPRGVEKAHPRWRFAGANNEARASGRSVHITKRINNGLPIGIHTDRYT